MADHVTRYCFQRTGTFAFAVPGVNQKSNPLLMKKSSPVTSNGRTFSIRRARTGKSIHCLKCAVLSKRITTVYVSDRPAIGRTMFQSSWPGEALPSGEISLNHASYSECCPHALCRDDNGRSVIEGVFPGASISTSPFHCGIARLGGDPQLAARSAHLGTKLRTAGRRPGLKTQSLTSLGHARPRSHVRPLVPDEARCRCPRGELVLHVVIVVADETSTTHVFEAERGCSR